MEITKGSHTILTCFIYGYYVVFSLFGFFMEKNMRVTYTDYLTISLSSNLLPYQIDNLKLFIYFFPTIIMIKNEFYLSLSVSEFKVKAY